MGSMWNIRLGIPPSGEAGILVEEEEDGVEARAARHVLLFNFVVLQRNICLRSQRVSATEGDAIAGVLSFSVRYAWMAIYPGIFSTASAFAVRFVIVIYLAKWFDKQNKTQCCRSILLSVCQSDYACILWIVPVAGYRMMGAFHSHGRVIKVLWLMPFFLSSF